MFIYKLPNAFQTRKGQFQGVKCTMQNIIQLHKLFMLVGCIQGSSSAEQLNNS